MADDAKALWASLAASLGAVSYKKDIGTIPSSIERKEKLFQFVKWVVGEIHPDNYLTPEQSRSYEDLKSAGKAIEGQALEKALKKLGQEAQSMEDIEGEVADMKVRVSSLKKQLQTLNAVQESLSDHYACLLHKRDELAGKKSNMQKHYHSSLKRAQENNTQIDAAIEDLMLVVKDLCAFHQQIAGKTQATPPIFLSDVTQDEFHQAEDQYLAELTAFTKKQFFKGLADLAHSRAPGEEETKFTQVDLDDSAQVILRGVTEEQYQEHCQELSRLQAVYPLTEVHCINAQLAERHAHAARTRAEQELETLSLISANDIDCGALKHQFVERQQRIAELRTAVQKLGQTQLTDLLQDMATLQVTRVLHGDYDLKIARQDYFIAKQEIVISHLQSQRSRHELLSMLYEVELRKHRDTHRILTTAETQLTKFKEENEKRQKAMENPALRRVKDPRLSIDSKDTFAHRLCAILGIKPSSDVSLLTHATLCKAVEQLSHQIATLQGLLTANDVEMKQLCQKQESLTVEFERELFGHNKEQVSKPILTVTGYAEQLSKLSSMVTSLEQNIKKVLKDYDGKKKVLECNPLLKTERKLFIYFFTEPAQLSQTLSELAKKVDSLALAK